MFLEQIDQWLCQLALESSSRTKALIPHVNRLGDLNDHLVGLYSTKLLFHRAVDESKSELKELQPVIGSLCDILQLLQDKLIGELQAIMKMPAATQPERLIRNARLKALQKDRSALGILRKTRGAYKRIAILQHVVIDDLRRCDDPPIKVRKKCRVFIASTSASKKLGAELAKQLRRKLKHVEFVPWQEASEFKSGQTIFGGLQGVLQNFDIGISIFGIKDTYKERRDGTIPLCNVALEFGMFAARHGAFRSIPLTRDGTIPGMSDLGGVLSHKFPKSSGRTSIKKIAEHFVPLIERDILRETEGVDFTNRLDRDPTSSPVKRRL